MRSESRADLNLAQRHIVDELPVRDGFAVYRAQQHEAGDAIARTGRGPDTNAGNGPGVLFGADQLALARYSPNGWLDPSFGQGGKVIFDGGSLDERILALAIAPDGSLLAGGYVNGERRSDLLLARLGTDGTLTRGFGNRSNGLSINDLGTNSERIASLVLQPDGKIVAGGQTAVAHNADFAVFRYDTHGLFEIFNRRRLLAHHAARTVATAYAAVHSSAGNSIERAEQAGRDRRITNNGIRLVSGRLGYVRTCEYLRPLTLSEAVAKTFRLKPFGFSRGGI